MLSALVIAALGTGCSSTSHTQYQVTTPAAGASTRAAVSPADREILKGVLQSVAQRYRMQDLTSASLVPDTVVFYREIESRNPLKLLAWTSGDQILVELLESVPGVGESLRYRSARETLMAELRRAFGENVSLAGRQTMKKAPLPAF